MNYDPFDHNVVIIGSGGSGKSHFAIHHFIPAFLLSAGVVFWVWDYNWQYSSVGRVVHSFDQLNPRETLVFQSRTNSPEEFETFVRIANKYENLPLVLEEVHEYVRKTFMPPSLSTRVRTGRNFGNTYIAVFQRPGEVHESILSNSNLRFVFRLDRPRDVDGLQKWIDENISVIKSMPNFYHYVHWKGTTHGDLHKPMVIQK